MAKMIVVEGPDRVGKFTQTKLLQKYITRIGLNAIVVEVPIRSAITYRVIYWMLQNGLAKTFPKIFQWFQFINRKIFQMYTLPILEEHYDFIVMDRWSLSTIIYGVAEGISEKYTVKFSKLLRTPDYTIILLGQAFPHKAEDFYEKDHNLQNLVRTGYKNWAIKNQNISTIIDCCQDRQQILKNICNILKFKKILIMPYDKKKNNK